MSENIKIALALGMSQSSYDGKEHVYYTKCGPVNVNFDTNQGRFYAKKAGKDGTEIWVNNELIVDINEECATLWDKYLLNVDNPPAASTPRPTPKMAVVERKTSQISEFERRDEEQIILAIESGAVLQDFFYEIPRGNKKIVGLAYAGAMQCKHNLDEGDNPVCFEETELDPINQLVLGDKFICLKIKAWRKNNPDGIIYGRAADPIQRFIDANTLQYAVTTVEHKAMRNAIKMLVEPKQILLAQQAYIALKKSFVDQKVLKSTQNIAYKKLPAPKRQVIEVATPPPAPNEPTQEEEDVAMAVIAASINDKIMEEELDVITEISKNWELIIGGADDPTITKDAYFNRLKGFYEAGAANFPEGFLYMVKMRFSKGIF